MEISRVTALEIFGLKEDFSESDLKREYRRLAKIVHPDTGGDEKLFKFLETCKNVLITGENAFENTRETSNHKPGPCNSNAKAEKVNAWIHLKDLVEVYPDYLYKYEQMYNIFEIKASLLIYIQPRFRRNLEKCITLEAIIPYSELNRSLDIVKFNVTIKIPKEMQKFRKFKVRIKFLNSDYVFNISDGDIKVMEHAKYEYVRCLKSVCELHFEK